ncbi:hypothetical protein GCM10012275_10600 [Longimycelium tulufanense]|uniref:Novel STAND NTPase 1 domain-containing protein n=1 Tax=Longimycelium tulufanense TaxID=907463 RepID=A0A8J3CB26_9PSEU|nr:WD40 repeat domain-containing protein [Longimycelium tulufanense]GGM41477.1 hypothetical protein GCM10012275_10600 [Longimycelium tulufanense]
MAREGVTPVPRPERSLDADATALTRFAADLRLLRQKAGTPTYRELSHRVHYSATTLCDAAGGKKLPSLAVALAYVRACGGDEGEWEQRWRAVAAESNTNGASAEATATESPYVGLAAFGTADADRFFGRECLVDNLTCQLRSGRFLALFGASGAGKSSLLRAGLIPQLQDAGWEHLLLTPGAHPLENCAAQLARLTGNTAHQLYLDLDRDERALHRVVLQALTDRPQSVDLVLIVDQFEELFTLCRDDAERDRFVAMLLAAAEAANSRARVVLGVRADFYGRCALHPGLARAVNAGQLLLGPMSTDELRRAITQPAARSGCTVEGALLAQLVAEAAGRPGVLPLLSHALRETWARRRGTALTLTGYQATGGIPHALALTAERAYQDLTEHQREIARSLFLRAVAPGEGTEDTKRRIGLDELDTEDPDTAAVVEALAATRLLTVDTDTVELSHEALITSWPRLRRWVETNREGLRVHRRLTEAAQSWAATGQDAALLHRGSRLAAAQEWARDNPTAVTALERAFLDASRDVEQQRGRRRRLLTVLGVLLVLLAVATSVVAVHQRRMVEAQHRQAQSRALAAKAMAILGVQPEAAVRLATRAFRLSPTREARSALLTADSGPFAARLVGHTDRVTGVVFSPDGNQVATSSRDRTVRLWDRGHRREVARFQGHTDAVQDVAFSPDGTLLASVGDDGTARLWSATERREVTVLGTGLGQVYRVRFSPDGRLVAGAGQTGVVHLWDVGSGARVTDVPTGSTGVNDLAFSPDGRTLVTAGADGKVRLWDVETRTETAAIAAHGNGATSVTFSPDGHLLATTGFDWTIRLWDVDTRQERTTIATDFGGVPRIAFSPDGQVLATAGGGGGKGINLWEISSRRKITSLSSDALTSAIAVSPDGATVAGDSGDYSVRLWHTRGTALRSSPFAAFTGVAFSPDGEILATGRTDGTLRLWDVPARREIGVLTGSDRPLGGVAFSPDGTTVAAGVQDGTVQLWDVVNRTEIVTLRGHGGPVVAGVAFSPDGSLLATTSTDGTLKLWDVARRVEVATIPSPTTHFTEVKFAPDGRTVATAGEDGVVRLWDVDTHRELAILHGHTAPILGMEFRPDGRVLATAGADQTVRTWDLVEHRELATLTGHTGPVEGLAFSPDGRTVASTGYDRTVRLWDTVNQTEIATLSGHTDLVVGAEFDPDGTVLATTGLDGTTRLWRLDADQSAVRLCRLAGDNLTDDEWRRLTPDAQLDPGCRSAD